MTRSRQSRRLWWACTSHLWSCCRNRSCWSLAPIYRAASLNSCGWPSWSMIRPLKTQNSIAFFSNQMDSNQIPTCKKSGTFHVFCSFGNVDSMYVSSHDPFFYKFFQRSQHDCFWFVWRLLCIHVCSSIPFFDLCPLCIHDGVANRTRPKKTLMMRKWKHGMIKLKSEKITMCCDVLTWLLVLCRASTRMLFPNTYWYLTVPDDALWGVQWVHPRACQWIHAALRVGDFDMVVQVQFTSNTSIGSWYGHIIGRKTILCGSSELFDVLIVPFQYLCILVTIFGPSSSCSE